MSDEDAGPPRVEDGVAAGEGALPGGAGEVTRPRGPELAWAALEAARAARRDRPRASGPRRPRGGLSGPAPDARDPQLFGALIKRLVADRQWERPTGEGTVFGAWERVVGPDIAAHCQPVSINDGELVVQAESTAWATQLRLLTAKLMVRIRGELGPNVVRRIRVHGPTAPSWRKGSRSVRGRGPRDTYG